MGLNSYTLGKHFLFLGIGIIVELCHSLVDFPLFQTTLKAFVSFFRHLSPPFITMKGAMSSGPDAFFMLSFGGINSINFLQVKVLIS
jgi:hypothetical protein